MTHSAKMMWGCAVLIGAALILAVTGFGPAALLALPCALMMGAMAWMMIRMGGGSGANKK
jgi:hypothetical protein